MRHTSEQTDHGVPKSHPIDGVTVALPIAENAKQAGIALNGLVTRRLGAYRDLPRMAAACRSPQDLAKAQMEFWTSARADYTELMTTMARVWVAPGGAPFDHDDADALHQSAEAKTDRRRNGHRGSR